MSTPPRTRAGLLLTVLTVGFLAWVTLVAWWALWSAVAGWLALAPTP